MPRKLIDSPPQLEPPVGFSHIAEATGRRLVFFAGQVALDADLQLIGEGDLHAQTVRAMRNLEAALAAAGATWDDVVRRTTYTTLPHEYETIGAAIAEVMGADAQHPAASLVGVSALAMPGVLIEIEATASLD